MESNRKPVIVVAVCALIAAFCPLARAQYGGGTGKPNDPYLIYTAEQMNAIGADPNDWDKHFQLMADIDLSAFDGRDGRPAFNIIAVDRYDGPPRPGGLIGSIFTGVFDGAGHTISNFSYAWQDGAYVGLFRRVDDPNASIKNLGLIGTSIRAEGGRYVGSLVGGLWAGTIVNCYVEGGTVEGRESVGGMVGELKGLCATLTDSHSSAFVRGGTDVGGLVGSNTYGAIITGSRATGMVVGDLHSGGLVGRNSGGITNCYATATTIGKDWTGGLVGNDSGRITRCFAVGAVVGDMYTGGLTGSSSIPRDVTASFWDINTTCQWNSGGGQGKTTTQMRSVGTYLKAGWDLAGETANGTDDIWWLADGQDYPRLYWEVEPGQQIRPLELVNLLTGTGTRDDPYLIYTAEDLNLIGLFPVAWDKHFRLVADIDLCHYGAGEFTLIGRPGTDPGDDAEETSFTGVFDGCSHVIRNLTSTAEGDCCVGLFRRVATLNAEIRNLGLIAPCIDADSSTSVGALVGTLLGGTVRNCYVEGGSIAGGDSTGGLVGCQEYGAIRECYSSVVVVGGEYTGGLVGDGRGFLANCYTHGTVLGGAWTGGLVGSSNGTISNCYSTSFVIGESAGGLAGSPAGRGWRTVTASFWDVDTSGQSACYGSGSCAGEGKTSAEMKDPNTFITAGWDFLGLSDGYAGVWMMDLQTGYPILWWQVPESERPAVTAFAGGTGTAEDPYLISSAEQLSRIRNNAALMNAHFRLISDIDLAGVDFSPIGAEASPFAGVLDGGAHTISNLTCVSEDESYVGLFRYVQGGGARVENLGLIDPNINVGTGDRVGVLAGHMETGTIAKCYVESGCVVGDSSVGGLVGYNGCGTITESYSDTAVVGRSGVGGLAGNSYGSIMNCYSKSDVAGDSSVGGLVGAHASRQTFGTITNSFAVGAVRGNRWTGGLVANGVDESSPASFWDIESTGQVESRGGTGKTTAEMQTAQTFLDAGWDFVGETANGTEDIWWIDEGQDYPRLWWEAQN
jgi:hypothetical protein